MRLLSRRTYGPVFTFLSQHSFHRHPYYQSRSNTRLHMSSTTTTGTGAAGAAGAGAAADAATDKKKAPVIAQYIFLRRDLDWPAGAVAAQASHASVAAVAEGLAAHDDATAAYVSPENLPHMTKMVYGVDDISQLEQVKDAWNNLIRSTEGEDRLEGDCLHAHWWVEQPENIPTAFATWPVIRTNKVSKVIKNLKLSYF